MIVLPSARFMKLPLDRFEFRLCAFGHAVLAADELGFGFLFIADVIKDVFQRRFCRAPFNNCQTPATSSRNSARLTAETSPQLTAFVS